MTSEFESVFNANEHLNLKIHTEVFGYPKREEIYFNLGLANQQSKVDELQKQRDSFIKAYEIEMDKSIDLQKRVDAALKMIPINRGFSWRPESISQLEQALKGESNG